MARIPEPLPKSNTRLPAKIFAIGAPVVFAMPASAVPALRSALALPTPALPPLVPAFARANAKSPIASKQS